MKTPGQQFVVSPPLSAQQYAIFSVISARSVVNLFVSLFLVLGSRGVAPAQTEPATPVVIKSETKVVLVDVVVTDKKQHFLKDLAQKDFHVYEDGVEQPITSFSREADLNPGAPERRLEAPFRLIKTLQRTRTC